MLCLVLSKQYFVLLFFQSDSYHYWLQGRAVAKSILCEFVISGMTSESDFTTCLRDNTTFMAMLSSNQYCAYSSFQVVSLPPLLSSGPCCCQINVVCIHHFRHVVCVTTTTNAFKVTRCRVNIACIQWTTVAQR